MNNSNPLIPQGSLLEQEQNKKRHHFKVAILCVLAFNVLFVGGMLLIGCRPSSNEAQQPQETPPPLASETPSNAPGTDMANTLPPLTPSNAAPSNVVTAPPQPMAPTPIPTPTPMPTPASSAAEYTVVAGDSFYSIGKKLGVSIKAIEAANPGVVPTKLKIGQKLQVPAGGAGSSASGSATSGSLAPMTSEGGEVYVVKSGDTLSKIAKAHGTSVRAVQTANDLRTFKIKVGQKLKMPGAAATPTPIPAPEPAPSPLTAPAPTPVH